MNVDEALRVLPDVEAVAPLRAVLLASAGPPAGQWDSGASYQTIGRRAVVTPDVRRHVDVLLPRVHRHLTELWGRYVTALERLDAGDGAGAVAELLANGRLEEQADRSVQARAWYASARAVAEGLPERRPELDALLLHGRLSLHLGYYEDAARACQRALALAEAEFETDAAIEAAMRLGEVAVERGAWAGAQSWYARALRLADGAGHAAWTGRVLHARGELARRRGDPTDAIESLRLAREAIEPTGDAREMARILTTLGLASAEAGLYARASAALIEALAWWRRGPGDHGLGAFIHLQVARVYIDQRHFLEAEQELRRAESIAISASRTRRLAQVYTMFGRMRGLQGDETGFVFFEQALALARARDPWPVVEAQVLHEYAQFKRLFGRSEESSAYLERAQEIFESLGASAALEAVRAELARVSGG